MSLALTASRAHHPPFSPEAAEWIVTVGQCAITRHWRIDGGYELHVGRSRAAAVLAAGPDGRRIVVNIAAGSERSPPITPGLAHSMALRIARALALS